MKPLRPKSLTTLIYGLLMLMPFGYIGVKCAYVAFNKNAYQSYSGESQTQQTYIHNTNDLIEGNTYYFKSGNLIETCISVNSIYCS